MTIYNRNCNNCDHAVPENHSTEYPFCAKCSDSDKLNELLVMITSDLWDFIPENYRATVENNLKQMGL